MNRGNLSTYRRLLWLAEHPDSTAQEMAKAKVFGVLPCEVVRWAARLERDRVIERRVVYRVRDDVRL